MSAVPIRFASIILGFAPVFRQRTWRYAQELLIAAILAAHGRTVARCLRVLGRSGERRFCNYHRVLSRASWCPRAGARVMLGLLVRAFAPEGPLVFGIDDTIERRRGAKIAAKGLFRDPVRSSRSHFVKASGLRWLSVMRLAPIPWARRTWALPVLTALAPSERYCAEHARRHKPLTDWARQMLLQSHRWLPEQPMIVVADSSFAVLELLNCLRRAMTLITRLRLDAQLFAPAPARVPGAPGRPRKKGARLPRLLEVLEDPRTRWQAHTVRPWYGELSRTIECTSGTAVWYHAGCPVLPIRWVLIRDPQHRFDPVALLSTDVTLEAGEIVEYFVRRWQVEVTFEEARRHLGLETQRQGSDRAIARTTPVLLGLFSIVTLLAHELRRRGRLPLRIAAWYPKPRLTFTDALAAVRAHCWHWHFQISDRATHVEKHRRRMLQRLEEAMCYAA